MIGKTKIAAGMLAALAVFAAGCAAGRVPAGGGTGSTQTIVQDGFGTIPKAWTTWPEVVAFTRQYDRWMNAYQGAHPDPAAAEREARRMVPVADTYLAVLRAHSPGPGLQGVQAHDIRMVTEIRAAAQDMAKGLRDSDQAKMTEALGHQEAADHERMEARYESMYPGG